MFSTIHNGKSVIGHTNVTHIPALSDSNRYLQHVTFNHESFEEFGLLFLVT